MILLGLGSNLGGFNGGPSSMLDWAISRLCFCGFRVIGTSGFVISRPFGFINQPDFVNCIVEISTCLDPSVVLSRLHEIERFGGRRRFTRWGARILDIDLLDYHGLIMGDFGLKFSRPSRRILRDHDHLGDLCLPHPGIIDRRFVLLPLAKYAPFWRHPISGKRALHLLHDLDMRGVSGGEVIGFV